MKQFENQLPNWARVLFRFIVHPEFQEEIEGDLMEKYQSDAKKHGLQVARRQLYAQLLSVLKPNLVTNFNLNTMKTQYLGTLILTGLAIMIASIAPFLPGPINGFSHGVSQFAQTIGMIGLAFVPFGLIWLIIEIRNKEGRKLNNWTNGYYPAWLAMTPVFVFLPLQAAMSIHEGRTSDWLPFTFLLSIVTFLIYRIQKLKRKTDYKFNPTPLYIAILPLVALITARFAVENAAAFSREKIIAKTEPLISAIDEFKTEHGKYPEKLKELEGKYIKEIPQVHVMGIKAYQYEKSNDSYQLSFEQLWHWNATEVVVYGANGHIEFKGNYDNFPTSHRYWRYYLVD